MANVNYETYMDIMSMNPIIDKYYLNCILGQPAEDIKVTEVKESNTALIIKAIVRVEDNIKRLFIKTVKHNQSGNVYNEMSLQEGKFYKFIEGKIFNNLPVPVCYDIFISEEKGEFLIVLEDVSNQYVAPDNMALSDKGVWFSCADSLARFHAAFWNHGIISQNKENNEHDAKGDRMCLQSFLSDFSDKFDSKTKTILTNAMEINISLINRTSQRLRSKDNVTICNGDSHIYNFMLSSVEKYANPLITDFQFWGEGIGTGDLAHLTRVGFSNKLKNEIQISLVEHYYKSLLKYGVTGYSGEDCLRDYRTSVASMVLIPLWQYTGFKLKYEEWRYDLHGLVFNYDYLNCDELYRV